MTRDPPEEYGSLEIPPLTGQERAVLQAIYDQFREHGTWPTFITIDRPIRCERRRDTGAIILSLPESLIVQPHPGNLRPIASDELRLLGASRHVAQTTPSGWSARCAGWQSERTGRARGVVRTGTEPRAYLCPHERGWWRRETSIEVDL
jgi:hypothetical protein